MSPDVVAPERLAADVRELTQRLHEARELSRLPQRARAHDALHDLVVRARLDQI